MSKLATLLLITVLAVSSLIVVSSAFAQSITKPSIPEFTLKYVDNSYDVPPTTTTTTDPYTNKTTTTTIPGYHVKNFTIEVTITNQPFPSHINGNATNLYYNVCTKGNFEDNWDNPYPSSLNSASSSGVLSGDYSVSLPTQSSSEYTVLSLSANSYPTGSVVDFQVEAILGYEYSYDQYFYNQQPHVIPIVVNTFVYQASGWSNTQTLNISESQTPNSSPTPTSTPYNEPQQAEQEIIIGVAVTVAVISAGLGLLLYLIKRK